MSTSELFTGSGSLTGSLHLLPTRSTYQVSAALVVSVADELVGRHDEKYNREPSGEKDGSRSRYVPENGSGCGTFQRPSAKLDVMSVIRGGENFVNTTVRPSGVNVDEKTSPLEITPGANMTAPPASAGRSALTSVRCLAEQPAAAAASRRLNVL